MNYISIYKWKDAPQMWKDLSTNGGDEDWLAFIPDAIKDEYMPFLEEGRFSNIVDSYAVSGGVVLIGTRLTKRALDASPHGCVAFKGY